MSKQFIITGIGTDIGKTVISAILAEALNANYWKPIQAGDLENSDSIKIKKLCSDNVKIIPELFKLSNPLSPHAAAKIDEIKITLDQLNLPSIEENLIIEGAGGIMVPLNDEGLLLIDLIELWKIPVIVISKNYLGSINHTLLTVEALKNRNISIRGIIFNGDENISTEQIILKKTGIPYITRIPISKEVNKEFILKEAKKLSSIL